MATTNVQALAGSVGAGGQNRRDDVALVQLLLNAERTAKKMALLKVDGNAGPATEKAIRGFQTAYLDSPADGRVDANGLTFRALAFAYFHQLSRGLVEPEKLPPGIGVDESSWRHAPSLMARAAYQYLADLKQLLAKNLPPAPAPGPARPQPRPERPGTEIPLN